MGRNRQEHLLRQRLVHLERVSDDLYQDREMLRELGLRQEEALQEVWKAVQLTIDTRRRAFKSAEAFEAAHQTKCSEPDCRYPACEMFSVEPLCDMHYHAAFGGSRI